MVPSTAVAAEADRRAPATTRWVVFRCADRLYGIGLEHVREIMAPRPYTRLPGCGPVVCGLIGVRGRVLTALDLGVRLESAASRNLPDHALLVLDLGSRRVGAAVDEVIEIAAVPVVPEAQAEPANGDGTIGTGRTGDGVFTALDPVRLLGHLLPT